MLPSTCKHFETLSERPYSAERWAMTLWRHNFESSRRRHGDFSYVICIVKRSSYTNFQLSTNFFQSFSYFYWTISFMFFKYQSTGRLRGVFTGANWDAEFKYFQNFWRLASSRQYGRGFRGAFRTLFGRWRGIFTFASKFRKFWSLGARKFISRHEAKAFRAISLHFGRGGEEFCGKLH